MMDEIQGHIKYTKQSLIPKREENTLQDEALKELFQQKKRSIQIIYIFIFRAFQAEEMVCA